MPQHTSITIILLGRTQDMAEHVISSLQPEVEVVHFIATAETAEQDLPLLLQHKRPANAPDFGLGTREYSKDAQAVVLGLGYTNDVVDRLRQLSKNAENGVPWLVGGYDKAEFEEMMKTTSLPAAETYGPITANKVKAVLRGLIAEGKGGQDGVYCWSRTS